MRSEQEILDLILGYAVCDENTRAVLLGGSRVNPAIKGDPLQDFDVAIIVRDVDAFRENMDINRFGTLMILQTPEDFTDPPPSGDGHYTYLMQFMDGIRIDLSVHPLDHTESCISQSLTMVLLDKDGALGNLPQPSESDFIPKKPTARTFEECCNEFWWVNPYVAKGLWRSEIIYAKHMMESVLRKELMKMLFWYFGIRTGFSRSPGKHGRNLEVFLEPELWDMLKGTYSEALSEQTWDSLFIIGKLFRRISRYVAEQFNFQYREQDDINVTRFIRHIRSLPREAKSIF